MSISSTLLGAAVLFMVGFNGTTATSLLGKDLLLPSSTLKDNCQTTGNGTNVNVICSQNCNSPCCSGALAGNIGCGNEISNILNALNLEGIVDVLSVLNQLLKLCQELDKSSNGGCTATATEGTTKVCLFNIGDITDAINFCSLGILTDDTFLNCVKEYYQNNDIEASCCTGDDDGYSQCTGNVRCGNSNRGALASIAGMGRTDQTAKCCTVECNSNN